jgi:hypothetical protein
MDTHGRANGLSGSHVSLTVNLASGLFTGNFLNPATGRPIKFQGVVNQAGNFAAGNFVAPNSTGQTWSGRVLLNPAP